MLNEVSSMWRGQAWEWLFFLLHVNPTQKCTKTGSKGFINNKCVANIWMRNMGFNFKDQAASVGSFIVLQVAKRLRVQVQLQHEAKISKRLESKSTFDRKPRSRSLCRGYIDAWPLVVPCVEIQSNRKMVTCLRNKRLKFKTFRKSIDRFKGI